MMPGALIVNAQVVASFDDAAFVKIGDLRSGKSSEFDEASADINKVFHRGWFVFYFQGLQLWIKADADANPFTRTELHLASTMPPWLQPQEVPTGQCSTVFHHQRSHVIPTVPA